MGQPYSLKNYNPQGSKPGELKHLSTRRKRKQLSDSLSSGERTGNSLNRTDFGRCGVVGPRRDYIILSRRILESFTIVGDSPVCVHLI